MFFVISGFLITSLLLREGARTGTISFIGFYKRRIRRLFPAALTVIVATLIAAHFIFTSDRFHSTAVDALWATLFGANWRSVQIGTDYFQSQGPVSPLQHYWSLSVEEQFYVVWPLVLLIVLVVSKRLFAGRRHASAAAGTAAAVALTAASLVIAAQQSDSTPVSAYFSTFTRGWELGLGAILAICVPYMRGNRVVLTAISWTGMALIVVSLFFVNTVHFPFPGAIAPCVGSAMVIAAHTTQARAWNFVLTNRLANYIGDLSYSIYVVHFPVIIFVGALIDSRAAAFYVLTGAMLTGLSMALFHLIEDPIRQSRWLDSKKKARPERNQRPEVQHRREFAIVGAALVVFSVGGFTFVNSSSDDKLAQILQADAPASTTTGDTTAAKPVGPLAAALQNQLSTAVKATSWPTLSPPLDQRKVGIASAAGCGSQVLTAQQCTWGNKSAKHVVYLVGDSTSVFYDDGFIEMMKKLPAWQVRPAGGSACAFAAETLNKHTDVKKVQDCPERNRNVVKEIQSARPDMLVVTTEHGDPASNSAVVKELQLVKGSVGKIVILPAPVPGKDPQECYTKVSSPVDCVTRIPGYYYRWRAAERVMAKNLGAAFIDPTGWICDAAEFCPDFVGHTPLRRDQTHITPQYAAYIAPVIREAFDDQHLFDG